MMAEQKSSAEILNGRQLAEQIKKEVAEEVQRIREHSGVQPCLAAVLVGEDAASAVYVRNKVRACAETGLGSEHHTLPATTSTEELLDLVDDLNRRDDVDGILVQLPLPKQIEEASIIEGIDPAKDVDGFHPINVGLLAMGRPRFVPCTPAGIMELLERNRIEIAGTNACVVGRSQIVGRPVASLLLRQNATVTICHSRTRDLASATRQADILVAAIGRAAFIRAMSGCSRWVARASCPARRREAWNCWSEIRLKSREQTRAWSAAARLSAVASQAYCSGSMRT